MRQADIAINPAGFKQELIKRAVNDRRGANHHVIDVIIGAVKETLGNGARGRVNAIAHIWCDLVRGLVRTAEDAHRQHARRRHHFKRHIRADTTHNLASSSLLPRARGGVRIGESGVEAINYCFAHPTLPFRLVFSKGLPLAALESTGEGGDNSSPGEPGPRLDLCGRHHKF